MLILPAESVEQTEARVMRMAIAALTDQDRERLLQLWCLVRSAESHQAAGEARERLCRLRSRIGDALRTIAESRSPSYGVARDRRNNP